MLKHASRKTSSSVRDIEAQIATNSYGYNDNYDAELGSDDGETRMGERDIEREAETENEDEAKLVIGVGSLSLGNDEAGRYLGASAAPGYYFDDEASRLVRRSVSRSNIHLSLAR
jgi:hypothetical protein